METLHISVSRSVHDGVFKGLLIHDLMVLSHLFYADDVVFVGEWSDDNLANLVRILQCFQLASGLKINMQKSQVLGVGVPSDVVIHGASTIGCNVMSSPFKYLRLTVGDHMSRHSAWSTIIQKIHSRLSMWKAKTHSIRGRLTLLKYVLGAVPLYTMSIYKAPKGVLHEMEISFSLEPILLSEKSIGLLGIKCWLLKNMGALVFLVIMPLTVLYFLNGYDVLSPKTVLCGLESLTRFMGVRLNLMLLISPHAGVLSYVRFIPLLRKALISFRTAGSGWCREPSMVRVESLLGSFIFSPLSDRWSCDLNGEGMFRVKDIRSILDDLFLPSSNEATRWAKYVPIKVNVFAWRARLDRLPTRDNLAKRGVIMDSSLCPICGLFPENAQHFFFGCDLVRSIALRICHWWNLNWTEISSFAEWNSWSIFDDSPPKRSFLFDDIVSFSFNWFSACIKETGTNVPVNTTLLCWSVFAISMFKKLQVVPC
nr:RNA-directed DNA polymerase, eukaryota [Tanacetum cinerariifolium]